MHKKIGNLLVFVFTIITILHVQASKEEKLESSDMTLPDALVWVSASNPSVTNVSITFPKVIPTQTAETLLAELLKETGWAAVNIQIISDEPSADNPNPMTSIEFASQQLIFTEDGGFLLEPFIKAFRSFKKLQILIITSPDFEYEGVGNFENKYINMVMKSSQGSYNFFIDIINPNFTDLGFPKIEQLDKNADNKTTTAYSLILLISVIIAILVFILTKKYIKQTHKHK